MAQGYSKASPYFNTAITGSYLDIVKFRDIPAVESDIEFTVTKQYEHRPDLLAYDLYGDARLWWIFAVRNKNVIKDPIYDLFAGQQIRLPKASALRTALGI
jgi:hypothetical protein